MVLVARPELISEGEGKTLTGSHRARGGRLRSSRRNQGLLLLMGLTLAAAALRLYNLGAKAIWYDEAFIIELAQMPVPDMLGNLIRLDPHPPLYYLVMHLWTALGTDPWWVRLPSVLTGTLSVPLLYAVASRLGGRAVGLGASAILVVAPLHVDWSQETRMYSMVAFLCLATTHFLLRGMQGGGSANWVAFSLLTAASLYTQTNAVFYLVAQDLAVVALLASRPDLKPLAVPWLKSQVGAAVLFLPWLPAFLAQNAVWGDPGHEWTTFGGIKALIFQFGYGYFPYWRVPEPFTAPAYEGLIALSVLVALLGVWSLRRRPGGLLLACLFAGTLGLLALAGLWRGILLTRTVLPASFAFYILLAAGLAAWKRKAVLIGGVALLVTLGTVGLLRYYTAGPHEDWQAAVDYLDRQLGPGEVVLVDSSAGLMPLRYYLDRYQLSVEVHGVPFEPWAKLPPPLKDEDFRRVDEITAGRPGIWLVVFRVGFPDPEGELLPYLASRFGLADERSLTKIRLFRFVPGDEGVSPEEKVEDGTAARREPPLTPAATAVNPGPRLYFGAWVGERVNIPGDVDRFERTIGKRLSIVHRYSDNPPYRGKRFDADWATSVREGGAIPMLSWQPGFGSGYQTLATVAAGTRDDYVAAWADQIKEWGHPIFLRMMWEQNSSWFPWRAYQEPQTSDFVAAWRRLVTLFRARGATNVTFVWSPHVSRSGAADIMATYPGDEYVDWVALDGYPFRGGRGDFVDTFGADYDLLVARVPKPIMIAETSLESWSDEIKAQWIRDVLGNQIPSRFPRIKALVWFEEKNTDGIDYSILQDQGPLSREAFRAEIASPLYGTNSYGDLETTPIPPPDALDAPAAPAALPVDSTSSLEAVPSNLMVDPGFEEGGEAGGWDAAWVVPSWVSAIVRRDSSSAASGNFSMLHSSSGGESYTVHQNVSVVAGATYDLSVAVRLEAPLQRGKATLQVQPLNVHGGGMETRTVANWQEATPGWTEVRGAVRMPAGASKARVQVRVTSLRGSFRLDDFSFVRSSAR